MNAVATLYYIEKVTVWELGRATLCASNTRTEVCEQLKATNYWELLYYELLIMTLVIV